MDTIEKKVPGTANTETTTAPNNPDDPRHEDWKAEIVESARLDYIVIVEGITETFKQFAQDEWRRAAYRSGAGCGGLFPPAKYLDLMAVLTCAKHDVEEEFAPVEDEDEEEHEKR